MEIIGAIEIHGAINCEGKSDRTGYYIRRLVVGLRRTPYLMYGCDVFKGWVRGNFCRQEKKRYDRNKSIKKNVQITVNLVLINCVYWEIALFLSFCFLFKYLPFNAKIRADKRMMFYMNRGGKPLQLYFW